MHTAIRRLGLVLAGGAALAAAGGCRTYISITAWEPGTLHIGPGKHVVIVGVEGRPSAREEVVIAVADQIRRGGYFTVEDQSESGAAVRVAGRNVTVTGGPTLAPDQLGLWFRVHEWESEARDVREEESYREKVGTTWVTKTRFIDRRILQGRAVLEFAVWGAGGRTVTAGREYTGSARLDDRASKDDARVAAGRDAVAHFLADLTPHKVTRYCLVDKSDPEQGPMIQLMARGQLSDASAQLDQYARSHPDNASAAYNLAVCADAMGDYDTALQWYERAISISGGSVGWYATTRDDCKRRRDAAATLATN
jgi:hypothetical protein